MKTLVLFLVIITVAINEIAGTPLHHYKTEDTITGTKEIIKSTLHEAALKSHSAIKAKGSAALAVAKAPIVLAKNAAKKVGLKVKKVAAGIVATKALIASKIAAAAAAAKAATAAKAALIAKAAFGIKLKAKAELKEKTGIHGHPLKKGLILSKGAKLVKHGLHAVRKPIEVIAHKITKAVVAAQKPIVHHKIIDNEVKQPFGPIVATLLSADR